MCDINIPTDSDIKLIDTSLTVEELQKFKKVRIAVRRLSETTSLYTYITFKDSIGLFRSAFATCVFELEFLGDTTIRVINYSGTPSQLNNLMSYDTGVYGQDISMCPTYTRDYIYTSDRNINHAANYIEKSNTLKVFFLNSTNSDVEVKVWGLQ